MPIALTASTHLNSFTAKINTPEPKTYAAAYSLVPQVGKKRLAFAEQAALRPGLLSATPRGYLGADLVYKAS
jgi:hypothetical protein